MRPLLLFLIALSFTFHSCETDPYLNCDGQFFGVPYPNTGLSSDVCKPICPCTGYDSRQFSENELNSLREYQLDSTIPELNLNPYDFPLPQKEEGVCAVLVIDAQNKIYTLQNYPDEKSAERAGAIVTHFDACGLCSTLQDFAVYAGNLDVGEDIRNCALNNLTQPIDSLISCIYSTTGFSLPCSQIWAYNAKNTQAECFQVCIDQTIYNNPDGSLSDCIACDEEKSGPVFKAVAGRTRRNTGIATAICRKCDEVSIIEHNYPL